MQLFKGQAIKILCIGYLILPIIIFFLGWLRIFIAVPAVLVILWSAYKAQKEYSDFDNPIKNWDDLVKILFVIGVIGIWVYYSGIGMFVFQNTDHDVRNTIFNILVQYKWPVINTDMVNYYNAYDDTTTATGLIYYIGYWLPSALVGKLIGLRAGYYFQALWAWIGIGLTYLLMCSRWKKVKIWPVFVMIFFSGLDVIGVFLTSMDIGRIWHLEWWSTPYQYSSMTTQLFWVFNQAIPAWLCTMMIITQKNRKNLLFILACSMLTSTFPFIGLLLLVSYQCLTISYTASSKRSLKNWMSIIIRDIFTVQNVLGGGIIGIFSFLYLKANLSSNRIMGENVYGPEMNSSLAKYVLFLILEVGIYIILLYRYHQKNTMFYFVVLTLLVFPMFRVGSSIDFCMRASIPTLFILMLWMMEAVQRSWNEKEYVLFVALIIVLIVGSVTPICEIRRTMTETFARANMGVQIEAGCVEEADVLNSPNFSGDIDKSFFFKYLTK